MTASRFAPITKVWYKLPTSPDFVQDPVAILKSYSVGIGPRGNVAQWESRVHTLVSSFRRHSPTSGLFLGSVFNNMEVLVTHPTLRSPGLLDDGALVHRGLVTSAHVRIESTSETLHFTSTTPYDTLFTPRVDYWGKVRQRKGGKYADNSSTTHGDWISAQISPDVAGMETMVFNPQVDGINVPNMWAHEQDTPLFVPLNVVSKKLVLDEVQRIAGGSPGLILEYFTLTDVALFLLQNHQTFVGYGTDPPIPPLVNIPSRAYFENILGTDKNLIRNFSISWPSRLADSLRSVLEPFGFSWFLQPNSTSGYDFKLVDLRRPTAAITLGLQNIEEDTQYQLTEVKSANLTFDVEDRSASRVEVYGARPKVQVAFELKPAWDPDHDTSYTGAGNIEQFTKSSSLWKTDETLRAAWRLFCANEGDDYTSLRSAVWPNGSAEFEDAVLEAISDLSFPGPLTDFYSGREDWIPIRRKPMPLLSLTDDAVPAANHSGIYLEWWDEGASPSGQWVPMDGATAGTVGVPNWDGVKVLPDELGIYWDTDRPPGMLFSLYELHGIENVKFRMTCTIELDYHLHGLGDRTRWTVGDGKLNYRKHQIVDARNRYALNDIQDTSGSDFESPVITPVSLERDDQIELEDFAIAQHINSDRASIDGTVILEGIDREATYYIGKPIGSFSPRGPIFDLNATPVCVEATADVQAQEIRLTLQAFR